MGMMLSMALYSNKQVKFVQAGLSVQLWRQGCPQKIFTTLNALGISQSLKSARGQVDRLRLGHDKQLKVWKEDVENKRVRRRLLFEQDIDDQGRCYSLTWDNVQMDVHTKHQSGTAQNKFLLWALCFAHLNKVPFPLADRTERIAAVDVDPFAVLPSPEVYHSIRGRMVNIVARIITDNIPPLQCLRDKVTRHIPHQYSQKMKEKSSIVNLGVVAENPSSTEGVIKIMEHLHQFVPESEGTLCPIMCCGDGLSIERMIHCKRARSNGETAKERLEGLVEGPQEFHKEILLLQDTMNMLFTQKSEACRGTLSQLKAYFRHKSMKRNVQENVQHVWDMVEFATCAYVCLMATDMSNMNTVHDAPGNFPDNIQAQLRWLTNLAQKVVDFCWLATDPEDILQSSMAAKQIHTDDSEELFPFCSCMEDKEDTMVQCCSSQCQSSWFHLSCSGLQNPPDGDWFCSPECANDGSYIYCLCHERKGGEMLQCHLKQDCLHCEWYHTDCLTQEQLDTHDPWYCSSDCLQGAKDEDSVQNYSRALLWEGLCHLVRRDTVREGDGMAMVDTWKLDMLSFWARNHYKYFIIGHHMLAGIGGFLPARLRHDLIWNRVANLKGGAGRNIGLDLVNEFLNNDFKEMLKHARGRYTDTQVARCAEMGGPFGQELDRIFTRAGLGSFITHTVTTSHDGRFQADIATFVEDFKEDGLFEYLPGRHHTGFEDFKYGTRLKHPQKMGSKMRQLAMEMDLWNEIAQHT
ncbi:uncharacterized protein [Branchiostoma lanceolatum]|uniref:uncharacterized protein n=1 Tax=Branchiostoma lanceolatum TaxID=7740 RepID=UPI003451EEBE